MRFFPYILLLILVSIFLWKPLFLDEALLPGEYLAQMKPWSSVLEAPEVPLQWNPLHFDAISQFYPWRVFYAREMSQGKIPLWNPHQFGGTPFLANGQSAVLYPINLLFLIFNPIRAFTIIALVHLFLAGVFTFIFARSLKCSSSASIICAVAYTYCSFNILWLELPTFLSVAVYLPLALFAIHKAYGRKSIFYGILSGLPLAVCVFAGHLQIALYVFICAFLWWIFLIIKESITNGTAVTLKKLTLPFLLCFLFAFLISAPQILPSIELGKISHRTVAADEEGYNRFISAGIPPYKWVLFLLPDYFGNPSLNTYYLGSSADYIEHGMYVGIFTIMLAVISFVLIKRNSYVLFFVLIFLFSVLSALGTIVNKPIYFWVPGISSFGGPHRIILLAQFALAMLAGYGIDYLLKLDKIQQARNIPRAAQFFVPVILPIVTVSLMYAVFVNISIDFLERLGLFKIKEVTFEVSILFFFIFVLSSLILFLRSTKIISGNIFAVLAFLLIVSDLFSFGANFNPICDKKYIYPQTETISILKELSSPTKLIAPINSKWSLYKTPEAILPPNAAMVYGLYDVQGYDSLYTRKYKDLSSRLQGGDSSPMENGNMVFFKRFTPELSDLAKYVVSDKLIDDSNVKLYSEQEGLYIYELLNNSLIPNVMDSTINEQKISVFSFKFGLFLMLLGIFFIFAYIQFISQKNRNILKALRM
ncbi:MAG: hypothetical protein SNJ70_07385 [Armatimonadota bacterium]